jgi:iron complex transport system substrate-binding protein
LSDPVRTVLPAAARVSVGTRPRRCAWRTYDRRRLIAEIAILAISCAFATISCRGRNAPALDGSPTGAPQRLVVLTPSLVEIAFALGLGPRVVGVTSFASYPPEATKILKVGDFLQPNVETIASLRPDLVLLDAVQVNARESLRGAGIYTLALPMESIADVRHGIRVVGDATGTAAAATRLIDQIDADLKAASTRQAGRTRPRVLFAVDRELGSLRGLVGAGPGTYLDDLIRRAGGDNVLGDASLRFFRVSPEEIVARRPTVIIDAVHTADAVRARQDWNALPTVPAVASGRVYVLADPAFVTPGPRLGLMLRRLTAILHPEVPASGPASAPHRR